MIKIFVVKKITKKYILDEIFDIVVFLIIKCCDRKRVPYVGALHSVDVSLKVTEVREPRILPPVGNIDAALGNIIYTFYTPIIFRHA